MPRLMRFLPLLLAFAAALGAGAGCNPDPLGSAADLGLPPDLVAPPPDLTVVPSGIGDPCTGAGGNDQGSCADGQFCIPPDSLGYTDGYCTANCLDIGCPADAECVRFGSSFAFCQKRCAGDGDCRGPEYVCRGFGPGLPEVCRPENPGGGGNGGGVTPGRRDGGACVTPAVMPGALDGGVWGANVQITGLGQSLEAEVQLAVAPGNRDVVVSYNKLTMPSGIGVIRSADDGMSWGKEAVLPLDTMVNKNNSQSDPVVAVDSKGNFFISWVGYNLSQQSPNPTNMNIYVARSSNGGATLDLVSMAAPMNDAGNGGQLDKPWIHASPLDDSIWVTWCRFNPNMTSDIRMARSTDHGLTFSAAGLDQRRRQAQFGVAQPGAGQHPGRRHGGGGVGGDRQ